MRRKRFICNGCNRETTDHYMLKDEIWKEATGPDWSFHPFNMKKYPKSWSGGLLCLECCEKRLGRSLTADDFTDAPINQGILEHGGGPRIIVIPRPATDWKVVVTEEVRKS